MIIIDSYKYKKYLLDRFPAAVAFSLRKIKSGQTIAIRVRRSSDNAQQDTGFVGNDLDTISLLSFCGAGDGFVTTWYDQSGNGYNVTQTTQANQPQIVSSGAVITDNGKPAVNFGNNVARFLSNTTLPMATLFPSSASIFRVINIDNDGAYTTLGGGGTDHYDCFGGVPPSNNGFGYIGIFASPRISGFPASVPTNGRYLVTYIAGTQYSVFYNGSSLGSSSYTYSPMTNGIHIGSNNPSKYLNGNSTTQEVIIYNSDQTTNRAAIESDINTRYSIY